MLSRDVMTIQKIMSESIVKYHTSKHYAKNNIYVALVLLQRRAHPKKHGVKNRRTVENTKYLTEANGEVIVILLHIIMISGQSKNTKKYSPGFYNQRLSRLSQYALNSHRVQRNWRSYGLKTLGQI